MGKKRTTIDAAPMPTITGVEEVGVLLVTRLGLVIGGIAVQSLLAYALLPEGRGAYAVCVMFGALLGALFSPGADRGIQYHLMAKCISVSEAVWVSLIVCLLGSVLAVVVSVPLILSDLAFFQKADRSSFFLSLPLIPLTALSTSIRLQLAGLRRFARLALISVIQTITNVVLLATLVLGLNYGVEGALVAAAASHGVMIIVMLGDLRRSYGLSVGMPSRRVFRRIMRYGWEYHIARMGQVVDSQMGALVLGMVAGRAEIGIFAVASVLLTRVLIISDAVSNAVLPRVAVEDGGRPALVGFCARVTFWVTGVCLVILCAVSVPLTRVIFPEPFLPAVRLMWIMAPGILVYSGTNVIMAYFRGINRPSVCSWVVWAGLVGNFTTVALLYPNAGVAAAAWGMTVGRLCRTVVLVLAFRRAGHIGPISVWLPQRGDARKVLDLARRAFNRAPRRSPNAM